LCHPREGGEHDAFPFDYPRSQDAGQKSFFLPRAGELRAVQVITNPAARAAGIRIFENMRVPTTSIISRVFTEGTEDDEAIEDLSWWKSSTNGNLRPQAVCVRARRAYDGVDALICIQD
jgi:hypothetical protein